MRIGVFGGTFDPPHLGHKKYAVEAVSRLELDKLIIIPTYTPPHKERADMTDSADRFNMLKLLFDDIKKAELSDIEIQRKGRSYTCDTVKELDRLYPEDELIFLTGSDMLLSFHRWKNPEEILKYVKICAVSREGDIGAKTLREYIEKYFPGYKSRFIIKDFDPVEISSTEVRNAVRAGKSVDRMLSPEVIKYIKEKELYL